jgi:hypothetical protein
MQRRVGGMPVCDSSSGHESPTHVTPIPGDGLHGVFAEDNRRCNVELLRSRRSVQRQKEDCSYNLTRFSSLFYFLILEKSLISIYNIYFMRIIEERAMICFSIYEFSFRPAPIEQAGNLLQKRGS